MRVKNPSMLAGLKLVAFILKHSRNITLPGLKKSLFTM